MTPACAWCGAPLDAERGPARAAGPAARAAARRRPTRGRPRRSWRGAYGDWYRPASGRRVRVRRRRAAAPHARRARARGSTRSRRPGRCSTSAPATACCSTRSRRRGREAVGPGARVRAARTCATSRSTRSRASGRRSCSGTRSSTCPTPGDGDPPRGAAARAAAAWSSWRCPNADSLQARAFGDRWLHLDLPRHLVHLTAARRSRPGSSAAASRVERVSHVRGGQIVIGWLDGLVGSLPGDLRPLPGAAPPRGARARRSAAAARAATLAAARRAAAGRRWPAPPSRSRCGAAAPSTWRRGVPDGLTAGRGRDAGAPGRRDARADVRRDPARTPSTR